MRVHRCIYTYMRVHRCIHTLYTSYKPLKPIATQRTFFEDMSTFFLHDILRALQILLTVRLSGYV